MIRSEFQMKSWLLGISGKGWKQQRYWGSLGWHLRNSFRENPLISYWWKLFMNFFVMGRGRSSFNSTTASRSWRRHLVESSLSRLWGNCISACCVIACGNKFCALTSPSLVVYCLLLLQLTTCVPGRELGLALAINCNCIGLLLLVQVSFYLAAMNSRQLKGQH